MSEKRYVVRLTEDERARLHAVVKTKRVAAQKRARAQVLLKVDAGDDGPAWTDPAAAAFDVHPNTVHGIRRRLVEGGSRPLWSGRRGRSRRGRAGSPRPGSGSCSPWRKAGRPPGARGGRCICWPIG